MYTPQGPVFHMQASLDRHTEDRTRGDVSHVLQSLVRFLVDNANCGLTDMVSEYN